MICTDAIAEARRAIAGVALRTPLVRADVLFERIAADEPVAVGDQEISG
jgi:hypothetical protein